MSETKHLFWFVSDCPAPFKINGAGVKCRECKVGYPRPLAPHQHWCWVEGGMKPSVTASGPGIVQAHGWPNAGGRMEAE